MKIIRKLHTLIMFPILFGCNAQEKTFTIIDSITVNTTYKQINNKIGFGLYNVKDESGFYFLENTNKAHVFKEGKEISSRQIGSNGQRIEGVAFDGLTNQMYYTQSNNLYQIDSGGILVRIKTPHNEHNYGFSSVLSDIQPKIYDGRVFLNIIDTVTRGDDKQSYIELCKKNVVLTGQISGNQISRVNYLGKFPSAYIAGNHYNNYYCNIEYDGKNLLMSFAGNDSVFLKNDKNQYTKYYLGSDNVKSDIKPIPFEDLKINSRNINYTRNSAKYIKIIYDPYRQQYLRTYQLKNNDLNVAETKWGIVFYDREFHLIRDVVFEIKNYNYLLVAPCNKGLIISKTIKDYANDKVKFDIISFY